MNLFKKNIFGNDGPEKGGACPTGELAKMKTSNMEH
jgi:hypothetical protein